MANVSLSSIIWEQEDRSETQLIKHFTDGLDWSSEYKPGKEKRKAGSKDVSHSSFCWEEVDDSVTVQHFFLSSMYCLYEVHWHACLCEYVGGDAFLSLPYSDIFFFFFFAGYSTY